VSGRVWIKYSSIKRLFFTSIADYSSKSQCYLSSPVPSSAEGGSWEGCMVLFCWLFSSTIAQTHQRLAWLISLLKLTHIHISAASLHYIKRRGWRLAGDFPWYLGKCSSRRWYRRPYKLSYWQEGGADFEEGSLVPFDKLLCFVVAVDDAEWFWQSVATTTRSLLDSESLDPACVSGQISLLHFILLSFILSKETQHRWKLDSRLRMAGSQFGRAGKWKRYWSIYACLSCKMSAGVIAIESLLSLCSWLIHSISMIVCVSVTARWRMQWGKCL